jgi:plasmid stabilization system protein ParE
MRFAIEFAADAEDDFDLIFDQLFEGHRAFGKGTEEVLDHAARRVMDIRKGAELRANFPYEARHATTRR